MTKRKVVRKTNRPFTYDSHYYNWGGDFKNALGGKPFDLKSTFSGANVAGMLKGGLANSIGSAVGKFAGNAISGGLESGAGKAISNIGGTIGGAVSAVNPVLGGIISAGTGIIGGVTNKLFGSKLNDEKIAEVKKSNEAVNKVQVDNSSTDSVLSQWSNQDFGADFSKKDIGKDGVWGNKAGKMYKKLKLQQDISRNRAFTAFSDAAAAADTQSDLTAAASYMAFGGPLGIIDGALGYDLAKEDLNIKKSNAMNKDRFTSLPNSFQSPELNTFAAGGYMGSNGADFTNGQIVVGNGGTHEENPMEGVPMGIAPDGNPNLVEEGEVIFNDYVFSNRIFADKKLLEQAGLPKSYEGYSFAAIAEKLGEESKERPNDTISKRGLFNSMLKLQQAQEYMRQQKQIDNEHKFDDGGPRELKYLTEDQINNQLEATNPPINRNLKDWEYNYLNALRSDNPTRAISIYQNAHPFESFNLESVNPIEGYNYTSPTKKEIKKRRELNARHSALTDKILDGYKDTDNSNSGLANLRYAPVVGAALGVTQNLLSKPDYSNADAILAAANDVGNFTPVEAPLLSNYLEYKPFDRNYYLNKLEAQANATRRAIMNSTSPSRNASLLAADYNALGKLGDFAREAEEYNFANRKEVESFNRGTNEINAGNLLRASMANQQTQSSAKRAKLSGIAEAMKMRDNIDNRRNASMSANLTKLFDNLGNVGVDTYNRNDRNWRIKNGIPLHEKLQDMTQDEYDMIMRERAKNSVNNKASNSEKATTAAEGGYLTIKKKRRRK